MHGFCTYTLFVFKYVFVLNICLSHGSLVTLISHCMNNKVLYIGTQLQSSQTFLYQGVY